MSTEPSGWQSPKTNWTPDDNIGASDLNRWEGNSLAIETGERTLDPAQAPSSNKGYLRQILDWFANRIKAITGATNWYDAPATTLAAAKSGLDNAASHASAASPHSGHATTTALNNHAGANITSSNTVHGIRQGDGNGLDADKLDGKHWAIMKSGSIEIAAGQTWSTLLTEIGGYFMILATVAATSSGAILRDHDVAPPTGQSGWWIQRSGAGTGARPSLYIKNNTSGSLTYYYTVQQWM